MAKDEASTRFPFIKLEKALTRAQQLFAANKAGTAIAVSTAFELWGYSAKSSGAFQTVGALRGYGLVDQEGANEDRKVRLSDAARKFFLDERDDTRNAMLRNFALNPPLFNVLWNKDRWSEGIPSDTVARSHLKLERNLNDQSARSLLSIFKENIIFAGLASDDAEGTLPLQSAPEEVLDAHYENSGRIPPLMEQAVRDLHYGRNPQLFQTASDAVAENSVHASLAGQRVVIHANVDLRGLRKLMKQLVLFENMLTLDEE